MWKNETTVFCVCFFFEFWSIVSHDETRIEELHKKRNYLAAYCKLVVYNVIPVKSAADIFKHYLRVSTFFRLRSIRRDDSISFSNANHFNFIHSATMNMATLSRQQWEKHEKSIKSTVRWQCAWAWSPFTKKHKRQTTQFMCRRARKHSAISR